MFRKLLPFVCAGIACAQAATENVAPMLEEIRAKHQLPALAAVLVEAAMTRSPR